ncbi:MAG: transglutaminase domain-containing protein [Actinomycetota bacterium]|nr:transglutaminase domain-containing protein [Actinomycetota bacterium]
MGGLGVRISLYVAALAAGGAFSILFTGEEVGGFESRPGEALLLMVGAAVVGMAVGSAGRYRFVLLPPAAVLYTQLAVYGLPPTSISGLRELLLQIGADVYGAANLMYLEPVPYDLAPGLLVLLLPLVVVLVAFSTSATLYERSPVFSVVILGVTLGVLSTSSFEAGAGPFFFLFILAAGALLLYAGAGSQGPGRISVIAGLAVVLLALALPRLPYADLTLSPGLVDWTRVGTWGTSRLDVQADVGDYLTAGRDTELLRVNSDEPLNWRAGTLDYFDGVRWTDTTRPGDADGEEIADGVPTQTVVQSVRVLNAQSDWVFGGYKIVRTSLEDAEQNSDGSWSIGEPLVKGSYYRVLSEVPQPTEEQLRGADSVYPAEVRKKFLQRPEDMPPVVSETAREIQGRYDTSTPYDTVRAIERYLVYDGGFVYNLDADFRRADQAIERFLGEEREGFCTQFATSMALLSRELGVPSRVVYGSTSGEQVEDDEWVVTGRNMHTWVEIYFAGVGWYAFDPTPGFALPATMEANAPRPTEPIPQQDLSPQGPAQQRQVGETPANGASLVPAESSDPGGSGASALPLLLTVPLALAVIPLAKRALRVRRRPDHLYRDLAGRLRDVLAPGRGSLADSPALTPTERMLLLSGAAGLAEEPFRRFAAAYSDHLYSPAPDADVERSYRRALREFERLPLWRRALGEVNPASLFARAGEWISASKAQLGKALRGGFGRLRSGLRRRIQR